MAYTWLDAAEKICHNCVESCDEIAGGGNCPYADRFDELSKLFDMRNAIEILMDGLGADNPICEGLIPIDEKVCGDYDKAFRSLLRSVEEPYLSSVDIDERIYC